jgi:hypothetical protein
VTPVWEDLWDTAPREISFRANEGGGPMRVPKWLRSEQLWQEGVAVRRDWPDGSHDLFGWRRPGSNLTGAIVRDRVAWLLAPPRPTYSVVTVSVRDFVLHGRRDVCRAPDCPASEGAVRAGMPVVTW